MRVMQAVNRPSLEEWRISAICVLLASFLFVSLPVLAQNSSQTTMTGTVVQYSKSTLVVKGEGDQYRLFVFDRNTAKPATVATGARVRVISTQTEDPEVRLAVLVAAEPPASAPGAPAAAAQPDVVPASIRSAERAIERETRKFHFGVQGGMALNPEVVDVGIHAKFGPFFSKNLQFRPNVDFAYGEISKIFALNGDFIYNISGNLGARRSLYFGAGPQFNFTEQSTSDHGVNFSDFHYSTALNILLGIRFRNGVFTELKTSVYAAPAPVLRLLVGYTF